MRWSLLLGAVTTVMVSLVSAEYEFTMSVDPPPVPGQKFTITWNSTGEGKIDILLNNFSTHIPNYPVVTTNAPIAIEIPNSGSFTWDVPSDLSNGMHSFSMASTLEYPVSYSKTFVIGPPLTTTSTTSWATNTYTTCITPEPTPDLSGPNPFLVDDYVILRIGTPFVITWKPTTSGSLTLLVDSTQSAPTEPRIRQIIARGLENTGKYTWTPDESVVNRSVYFELVDENDNSQYSTSITNQVRIVSKSQASFFEGSSMTVWAIPGQPYPIKWNPSDSPTVTITIQGSKSSSTYTYIPAVNVTIADQIPNNGSITWTVPLDDSFIVPGVHYWVAITDDSTGNWERRDLLVLNSKPQACPSSTSSRAYWDTSTISLPKITRDPTASDLTQSPCETGTHAGFPSPIYLTRTGTSVLITSTLIINSLACGYSEATGYEAIAPSPIALECQPGFSTFGSNCCPQSWTRTGIWYEGTHTSEFCYTTIFRDYPVKTVSSLYVTHIPIYGSANTLASVSPTTIAMTIVPPVVRTNTDATHKGTIVLGNNNEVLLISDAVFVKPGVISTATPTPADTTTTAADTTATAAAQNSNGTNANQGTKSRTGLESIYITSTLLAGLVLVMAYAL